MKDVIGLSDTLENIITLLAVPCPLSPAKDIGQPLKWRPHIPSLHPHEPSERPQISAVNTSVSA